MTDYAIENIKGLEDMAPKFGLSPQVEARFGRKSLAAEQSGISYQQLEPNYRQGFGHMHKAQEETYVILSGGGRMKIGEEIVEVKEWDAIRLAPATPRAFEAGADGITFLAFGAGESGDAEMLEDFWPTD